MMTNTPPRIVNLLQSITFGCRMVVEFHGSSKGVILNLDSEPYKTTNAKGTTITNDMDYPTNQLGLKTTVCVTLKHENYSLQHSDTTQELKQVPKQERLSYVIKFDVSDHPSS